MHGWVQFPYLSIMEKKDFVRKITEGNWKGLYRILIDPENNWGPIMEKWQADEYWSLFKNSGKTFEEFTKCLL